jgi:hypothetical protein
MIATDTPQKVATTIKMQRWTWKMKRNSFPQSTIRQVIPVKFTVLIPFLPVMEKWRGEKTMLKGTPTHEPKAPSFLYRFFCTVHKKYVYLQIPVNFYHLKPKLYYWINKRITKALCTMEGVPK